MTERVVGVVLFGCGTVGRAVLRRLAAAKAHHAEKYQLAFKVRAVVDSSGAIMSTSDEGVDSDSVLRCKEEQQSLSSLAGFVTKNNVTEPLAALQQERNIFVDCTATDSIAGLLQDALSNGAGVVFANKKCLTGTMSDFKRFTDARYRQRCRFESAVGAGTPFVAATSRIVAANDGITALKGTFSGTLGYITAGLDEGRRLSELVAEAFERGFTEPDPRDDLSGTDVARKALILSRVAGWERDISDLSIEALYPSSLADVSVGDFLSALADHDAAIEERRQEAEANGRVLRYVAEVTRDHCRVGLQSVLKDTPIGALKGTDNILNVESGIYEQPLVVQGSGAGPDITAAGVVADMVEVANTFAFPQQ